MTLTAIIIMGIAALLSRFLRRFRRAGLLFISLVALYALQPSGLDLVLPTATVVLVVGAWWIVAFEASNFRRIAALVFIFVIVILLVIVKLPILQSTITSAASQAINQPLPLNWQWFGFSYIAFRLMHVLLDFRSGILQKRIAALPFVDFALYVIFFPALAAGPIDRIEHFTKNLDTLNTNQVADGFIRIGVGLFKKFVLADTLAYIALSPQLVEQAKPNTLLMWVMLYAYAFQLFFDFSGYTDIAIGTGLLAGIRLPENFNSPYLKPNITVFWNNWHMTLSMWFRNYIFTPLSRTLINSSLKSHKLLVIFIAQIVTMVLIGLWHGIAWNFVLWGLWHGVGLWFHKWFTDHSHGWNERLQQSPRLDQAASIVNVVLTFHFVAIGWIFFALPSLPLISKALLGLVGR
jgi:alginate O-acetyltransferase complex protein AlgI